MGVDVGVGVGVGFGVGVGVGSGVSVGVGSGVSVGGGVGMIVGVKPPDMLLRWLVVGFVPVNVSACCLVRQRRMVASRGRK